MPYLMDPFISSDEEGDEEEETQSEAETMKCVSCKEDYVSRDAGTCRECFEEASETEEELRREIDELRSKVNFLRFSIGGPVVTPIPFSDIVLAASDDRSFPHPVPIPAHRSVLASRSPVFRAMLENKMEESLSGTIKISDVSYDALRTFVHYLYTAEACLEENMACNLLILAEKYQVKHLKNYCEKFLISKLLLENSLPTYAFAHQHNAKNLLAAALDLIMENMTKLKQREEYAELVEKDPRLVIEIYEAYLLKQSNATAKDSTAKS